MVVVGEYHHCVKTSEVVVVAAVVVVVELVMARQELLAGWRDEACLKDPHQWDAFASCRCSTHSSHVLSQSPTVNDDRRLY